MAPQTGRGAKDLASGAVLQMVEAATLGMPFEVWKTRMGRYRNEGTFEAFANVYRTAGGGAKGVGAYWKGLAPKLVESASKGAVLLYSKEVIKDSCLAAGATPFVAGLAGGAGGGVAQVAVMGPCTFVVTAVVTGGKDVAVGNVIRETWAKKGIKGFYPGGTAIAWRQATNWASRQGFTDGVRTQVKKHYYKDEKAKLTTMEEAFCGIIGGTLATWNQPFEVSRIEMQARANAGQPALSMVGVMRMIVKENGIKGLFQGIVPRIGLGIWQTTFMVTGANIIRERYF